MSVLFLNRKNIIYIIYIEYKIDNLFSRIYK